MSRPCSTFLNEAFTDAEKSYIPLSKIKQEKLSGPYEDAAGKDTMDQIFLLNLTEATKYFENGWHFMRKEDRLSFSDPGFAVSK